MTRTSTSGTFAFCAGNWMAKAAGWMPNRRTVLKMSQPELGISAACGLTQFAGSDAPKKNGNNPFDTHVSEMGRWGTCYTFVSPCSCRQSRQYDAASFCACSVGRSRPNTCEFISLNGCTAGLNQYFLGWLPLSPLLPHSRLLGLA